MFNAFCSGVNIVSIVPFLGRQSPVAREVPHPPLWDIVRSQWLARRAENEIFWLVVWNIAFICFYFPYLSIFLGNNTPIWHIFQRGRSTTSFYRGHPLVIPLDSPWIPRATRIDRINTVPMDPTGTSDFHGFSGNQIAGCYELLACILL